MIGKKLGNLTVLSKIGEGGMGVVYLAEHQTLRKKFAVKSLLTTLTEDSGFRDRFYQEAVNHASLDHPNIVQATDFFEQDGQFFFVMEYVKGKGLDELITQSKKLTEKEILHIFKGILRGLNFAHSKGVIHRDIKPSNVIVDESQRARITDFGIAILVGDKRLTAVGSNIGSVWYMSPEQILHPRDVDHRSDVYSAGIVLYEMLTGKVPFDGETEYSIKDQQVKANVPDPIKLNPKVTPQLQKSIYKALEKEPDRRFSGCGEFLQEIEAYQKEIEEVEPRSKYLWIFLSIVVLMTAFIIGYLLYENRSITTIPASNTGERDAAFWIDGAAVNASRICNEVKKMEIQQIKLQQGIKSLKIISTLDGGDKEIREGLANVNKKIKDHENNINEFIPRYSDFINKLSQVDNEIVVNELSNYSNQLVENKLFPRIKALKMVKQHYQESQNHKFDINIKGMSEFCSRI